jgi:RimJ/RimL family protein N-acetyltransferase/GNAT superfamily N-acetyltransferase
MNIEVLEDSPDGLKEYSSVPTAFEVRELFDAGDLAGDPRRRVMTVRAAESPFVKDYDAIPQNEPRHWLARSDLTGWKFFGARSDEARVGGAAMAFGARRDLAVLWDIRVAPTSRHAGVGIALVNAIESWALEQKVSWLEAETQNVNVPAYQFYLKHGFTLTDVRRGAYPEFPLEVQLLLHKRLGGPHAIPDEITTPRLLLRRWRKADAPQLKAAIDDNLAHLQRWMPWAMSEPSPIEVIEQRLAGFEAQFDRGVEWLFAIRSRETDRVIGGTGLHPRIGPDGLEIGYWLAADATGKGYATEAADALTRVALRQPGVERVQIRCDPKNVLSAGIPRRLGYDNVLTIENEMFAPTGSLRDTMVWEIRRRTPPAPGPPG